MLGTIAIPGWLQDFWTVYGQWLQPILTTILTTLVTWLSIKVRSEAKLNAKKAELQLEALKNVSNREDNKPELAKQSEQIETLNSSVAMLGEMFNIVFQNSDLDPETKLAMTALYNKLKYGTDEDLVAQLEDTNAKLKEQIDELTAQLNAQLNTAGEETTEVKRQRR